MLSAIAQKLLNAAFQLASVATTPRAFRQSGCVETTHEIEWTGSTSGGEITIETADAEDYTGQWAPIAVVTWTAPTVFGNPHMDYVRVQGNYRAFRHRISAIVLDGTVTTRITGAV